ncbi:MAG: DUF4258 domain-containing protein [Thaumarchaeota archaeon]|nr:DUF4258 domain-containing protein [Nitrososphaerota archaeon]
MNESHVIMAVQNPDSSYEEIESDALVAVKRIKDRNLVVVYAVRGEKNKIITVYHASNVGKLIRQKAASRSLAG